MDEIGPTLREKLMQYPPGYRNILLKDALQQIRFMNLVSTQSAINTLPDAELQEFKNKFSRFTVFSAWEWFQTIPYIQHSSEFLQIHLKLMLNELICTKKLIGTEGWDSMLVKASLLYWTTCPDITTTKLCPKLTLGTVAKEAKCIYCLHNTPCMACSKAECKGAKFLCHIESGVHLCMHHGRLYTESWPNMFGTCLQLEDGRNIFPLSRAAWCDKNNMEIEPIILQPRELQLSEFDEYTLVPESTKYLPDISNPDEFDKALLEFRDLDIQKRATEYKHTF